MIRIGTSGFSYKEWVGSFYPARTPGNKMLAYYAARMPTVEINYTFRAMPRPQMLEGWVSQTPADFRFALKASQRITHLARLKHTQSDLDYFISVAEVLGERLGPTLFQLPPGFKKDVPLLRDFLTQLDGRLKAAFEFRDQSWFDDAVYAALEEGKSALCIAESDKLATPVVLTAPYAYLRLRKEDYDESLTRAVGRPDRGDERPQRRRLRLPEARRRRSRPGRNAARPARPTPAANPLGH